MLTPHPLLFTPHSSPCLQVRQAAQEAQLRTPFFLTDAHPEGPRSASGQPIVFAQSSLGPPNAVPWRQNLLFQLLTLAVYEEAQAVIKAALPKPKKAGAAAQRPGGQAALFQQMMRSRLPPTNYFVEQMVEGEWCGLGMLTGAAKLQKAAGWMGNGSRAPPGKKDDPILSVVLITEQACSCHHHPCRVDHVAASHNHPPVAPRHVGFAPTQPCGDTNNVALPT